MDKSARNHSGNSQRDQNSLGILSMENLRGKYCANGTAAPTISYFKCLVFGDMSGMSKSGSANTSRESLNIQERLRVSKSIIFEESKQKKKTRALKFRRDDLRQWRRWKNHVHAPAMHLRRGIMLLQEATRLSVSARSPLIEAQYIPYIVLQPEIVVVLRLVVAKTAQTYPI